MNIIRASSPPWPEEITTKLPNTFQKVCQHIINLYDYGQKEPPLLCFFFIPPIKRFDGSLTLGRDAFALEYLDDGEEENLHIKEEGEVIHVIHIILEAFGEGQLVTAVNQRPACDARAYLMTAHLLRNKNK